MVGDAARCIATKLTASGAYFSIVPAGLLLDCVKSAHHPHVGQNPLYAINRRPKICFAWEALWSSVPLWNFRCFAMRSRLRCGRMAHLRHGLCPEFAARPIVAVYYMRSRFSWTHLSTIFAGRFLLIFMAALPLSTSLSRS